MLYAIVAVIALIIDQAVKYWATANIVLNTGEKNFIPGILHFTNIHNTGAAFSILEGARWFFVILCLVFVALIVYVLITDIISAPAARWAAVIVMAGAVGNCIDRLICGYVVDMLEFEGFLSWFPVFNIADIYITVGAIFFVVFTLLEKPAEKSPAKAAAPAAKAENVQKAPAKKSGGKALPFELPFGKKKTPIPEFPKREKAAAPAAAKMDPNDPFAEWERRASEIKAANEAKGEDIPAYVKPEPPKAPAAAPAAVEKPKAPARPAVSYPAVSAEPEMPKAAPAAPAAPVVEAPKAAPAAPVAPVAAAPVAESVIDDIDEFDFNIDDIMAEFKDL